MEVATRFPRWLLAFVAGCIVTYCVVVLAVVATAPDLRLRFLLSDAITADSVQPQFGILIQQMPDAEFKGKAPKPGDRLVSLDQQEVANFLDFSRIQLSLRNRDIAENGLLPTVVDPLLTTGWPSMVQTPDGKRWVKMEYVPQGTRERQTCAVQLQSIPIGEVGLTLVWFLLQLLIFSVGAVAFWNRPFDESARRFFVMCTATLAAFIGGFHWSIVAGSFWLTLPFGICGILLPAFTLHFFLVYPRPKPPLTQWPVAVTRSLYALPLVATVCFVWTESLLWSLIGSSGGSAGTEVQVLRWLNSLTFGIYAYLSIAAAYFLMTLASLSYSVYTTRNPVERSQVRWIFWAGFGAAFCIGYALLLAAFSRADFALGGARVPMFLASLVFMLAYAVGIVRYKLMLIDQIINRGMWYYVLSYGATGTVALVIACGSLAVAVRKTPLIEQQSWIIAGILMLTVVLLIWLRDAWQRLVDRRFFREKYQLDRALQRMHREVGRLTDVQFLSERMALSCRDVLQSERVALYLRDGRSSNFRLMAVEGVAMGLPMQLSVTDEFVKALAGDSTLQRVTPGSRDNVSPVQTTLRLVQADLVHGLETDGELAGLVVLGPKQSGALYSAEDLTFLTALGQITGVALHCAKVHQDITNLNEELRLQAEQIAQQKQQITILQAEVAASVQPDSATVPAMEFRRDAIIGHSAVLERILDTVRKVAVSETSVLIRGESGTGKELLAKAIHDNSPRRDGPLISVHCAALSAGLLESELFGHVKGAFTGATADKQGRFELAHGGTLFLDEIGDISSETQIKLLRVLQQREFEPVGGTSTVRVDVRLVAATHQNLERLIAEGKFREDLYYRLNVVSLTLPPLRERPDDVLELAVYFLKKTASRAGKRLTRFEDDALDALMRYSWPGNIRELQNVIERAIVMAEGDVISVADLPSEIQSGQRSPRAIATDRTRRALSDTTSSSERPRGEWIDDDPVVERQALVAALHKCGGNKAQAARLLGLPRSTYFSKLKKHGIRDGATELEAIKRLPR